MDVSFFAEMAWKSALIAGAALMLATMLRSRAAADRALVLRIGVTMLLLLPLIAVALPVLPVEAWAAPEAIAPAAASALPAIDLSTLASAGLQPAEPTIWDDPTPLVLLAYVGGLAMAGSRLLAGLITLGRWTRAAREVTCPQWLHAFEIARWAAPNGERLRLMVSDSVPSPLSWGWIRPVILIDPDTMDAPEEAAAILAHEVAHVARRDWPVLMLSRVAATLFWFNPLVWLLEREVVQQAEEAADCAAAECVEPARYARTLLSWAQVTGRPLPANSIAPSGSALSRRVKAILDRRTRERPSGSAWTAAAILLCIGIATPVAAMKLVAAAAPTPPAPPAAPHAPQTPPAPDAPDSPAPVAPLPPGAVAIPDFPEIEPMVREALASVLPQIPGIVASATAAIDPEEIERALREARVEFREMDEAQMAAITQEVSRAVAAAQAHAAQTDHAAIAESVRRAQHVDHAAIAESVRHAQRAARHAPRAAAVSMAHSAEGMIRGADGMEAGAERMERQAEQLRDRDYRERQIARAAARGRTVTHEQLLEAAEGLHEGARGMREGAREMRESAQRMRDGRH